MRGMLAVTAAVVAVLVAAAPATTGSVPPDHGRESRPAGVPARPAPPGLSSPAPEGCTVPVGTLEPCAPGGRVRPPVSCVLPVDLPDGPVVRPACPRHRPSPGGRVLPLTR